MSLIIDLPNELEQKLEAEAKRQGLSTDALARILLEEKLNPEEQNGASAQPPRVLARDLPIKDRAREVEWLKNHRDEYAGQWVALNGEKLIASGDDLKQVVSTARRLGVPDALMMRVEPNDALPFAGF
jgi:plasmid stability protein